MKIPIRNRSDDPAVCPQGRQVARRIEEPESLPFVDDHPQIFAREEELLHAAFGPGGVDRDEAADRGRKGEGKQGVLQEATHREFLHER